MLDEVVDVAHVDIARAANAARHLYVATFLLGFFWLMVLNANFLLWTGGLSNLNTDPLAPLIAIGCFGITLNVYARRSHKRACIAFIFDVGLYVFICFFVTLRSPDHGVDWILAVPLIVLFMYLVFVLVLTLRVFYIRYETLRTTPLDLANMMSQYAKHHRSPVPTLHRPNRPVGTIMYGILFIVVLVLYLLYLTAFPNIDNKLFNGLLTWITIAILIHLGASFRRNYTFPADKVLTLDTRRPVLYLRSFSADRIRLWGKGVIGKFRKKTIDEAIAPIAMTLGPFIAIANPDSKLPYLGAAKTHYTNDTWQTAISRWVAMAQIIVMVAGRTEGIRWEIAHIFENSAHTKLVVILPIEMRRDPTLVQAWFRQNFSTSPYLRALDKIDYRCAIALIFRKNDIVLIETRRVRRSVIDYLVAFQMAIYVSVLAERETTSSAPQV